MIHLGTSHKPRHRLLPPNDRTTRIEKVKNILVTSINDLIIVYLAEPLCDQVAFDWNIGIILLYSFLFEVTFDFGHYWSHRLCHTRLLYFIHKKHHEHTSPSIHTTFHQDPFDLILTNVLPFVLSVWLIRPPKYILGYIIVTKSYTEMSGHVGKQLYPASSFPQLVWLPRLLDIEIYAEDHHYHHMRPKFNYSKRFKLWDNVFGTYQSDAFQ